LILVIDGALPEFVRSWGFFHHPAKFCVSEALNLGVMIEDEHANRRDKKENENAPDAVPDVAQECTASLSADFPAPVNLNPFIDFARGDFHARIYRKFYATALPDMNP
jgi:hypothetical protein